MTYMYSIMFILLSGSQSNALMLGSGIIQASTPPGTQIDFRVQKLLAIVLVGVICQMQSMSRLNYIRFSNAFAIYKVTLLTILTILGWCALGSYRTHAAALASHTPYGTANFYESFKDINAAPYGIALAFLDILRVYSGYLKMQISYSSQERAIWCRRLIICRFLRRSVGHLEMRHEYSGGQQFQLLRQSPFSQT
jgi:hypothetical protein